MSRRAPLLRKFLVLIFVLLLAAAIPPVRVWLTKPLVVTSSESNADAAYVLSGGAASRERLAAAADLVHMRRVPRIYLTRDSNQSAFNFKAGRNFTPTEWAVDYLKWLGVPEEAIEVIEDRKTSKMGTLDEAQSLAAVLPANVNRVVLVTSPAHTRRSMLAFSRTLPARVTLLSYPATEIRQSTEFYHPLSVEYLKLLVYAFAA